jgi:soluble lytic murein transglycosylase-like protein
LAVVSTESSFKSGSISQDGHETKGLFQFLDSTGREILTRFSDTEGYAPLDPGQNVNLGIRYLTHLNEIFSQPTQLNRGLSTIPGISGDSRKRIVLAAFNAGEGRVVRAQMRAKELGREPGNYSDISDFLPRSTTQYVERVLRREEEFSARNRQEPTPSFWR